MTDSKMPKCELCKNKATTKAVIQGVFGEYCNNCCLGRSDDVGSASYSRDRDREDHAKDMLQPWIGNKPNPEFATAYPDSAKDMYTEEQLKDI